MNRLSYFKELDKYEILPDILSDEEIYNYFLDMKKGNNDIRKKIIEHNLKLVIYEVNLKFSNSLYEKDDMISAGVVGLIKAVDSYDVTKNNKFSTFAFRCIDNEIKMSFRNVNKHLGLVSLDSNITNESNTTIGDTIPDENDRFEDIFTKEEYEAVRRIISELPLKEKIIIEMYFGFNNRKYKQVEITKVVNISQSYLSKTIKDILDKIKSRLIEEDIIIKKYVK